MSRGRLGLRSALAAAASGDVPRAVHLLRRIRGLLAVADVRTAGAEPGLGTRIGERLAYYLLQMDGADAFAEALQVARETVDETSAEPPTWYLARAMATYAIALMVASDNDAAREWAEHALTMAGKADAPSVEADARVTLGQLSGRSGDTEAAIGLFTKAFEQAADARVLGVELRAAYSLAAEHLARGELTTAATIAHKGVRRADAEGLGLAPFGMDLQHLHFQAHYADGEWDHAQELADGFPVRVTSQPEAVLSAMALFLDVATGNSVTDERHTWLEPFWNDSTVAYIGQGLLAEQALWRGDTELALAHAQAAISADSWPSHGPSVLRVAAIAVSAHADRAIALRAAGNLDGAAAEVAAAAALLDLAREGARYPAHPKRVLGPEGRGWLARCRAEYERARGANSPSAWEEVLAAFGPDYAYETARTQWRLAESLAETGRRDDASAVWRNAAATAAKLLAAPLTAALADLARRAAGPGGHAGHGYRNGHGPGGVTGSLTDREREVLRLLARGRSNREIGT